MKKLLIAVLLLYAVPAWAVTPVYDTGPTSVYPAASGNGNGGAALSNIADWTKATGLVADGAIVKLTDIVNTDSFNDSSLGAMWNSQTANSGTVVETTSLLMNSPSTTDASFICYEHDLTRTNNYRVVVEAIALGVGPDGYYMALVDSATAPTPDSLVNFAVDLRAFSFPQASGVLGVVTYDSVHTLQYWNVQTSSLWQNAAATAHIDIFRGETWTFEIENDGTTIYQRVYSDSATTDRYLNTYRAWSTMEAETNQIWLCIGDFYDNTNDGAMRLTYFAHYGDYLTTSPVATMGQITVGAEIKRLGLFESCESGATITWRYDIGAGWVTAGSGTLSELETALVSTSPATLNLEAAFNSNGTANCELYSDGSSITTD
jgi:hypothetical protein